MSPDSKEVSMKLKNVEVDQRVIIKRSTSAVWDTAASHIGEEFTVLIVEPLSYTDATVCVQGVDNDDVTFWCNHRDLKLVKEEAPISGALFVVTGCTTLGHCFDVGTVVRCANPPMGAGGNCRYEDKDGELQFVSPSDLKSLSLADIQVALDK